MVEIKISELSIGDWVATPSAEGYIIDLYTSDKAGCIARLVHDDVQMTSEWECRHLEPIPLTPEILEKNGFEEGLKNGEAYKIKVAFNQHLWLFKVEDGCWMFRLVFGLFEDFDIAKVKIKYVHQLQNALRLAGVGKEIVL